MKKIIPKEWLGRYRLPLLLSALCVVTASYAKIHPLEELRQTGFYGRVHAWGNIPQTGHDVAVKVPPNAPVIISDFHSNFGANGLRRSGKHAGIDLFADIGSPVIAAADGVVVKTKNGRCWGPTMLINHGVDREGRPLYALYGHMRNFKVKPGDRVKRGQQIAEMGEDIYTTCGAGFHHLHFQISHSPGQVPFFGWGWASFVNDGARAPNPHNYWEKGVGEVTCFEEGKRYDKHGLTYPLPCGQLEPRQFVAAPVTERPPVVNLSGDRSEASQTPSLNDEVGDVTGADIFNDTAVLSAIDRLFSEAEE